jgi:Protein of unknown function (DUF2934)
MTVHPKSEHAANDERIRAIAYELWEADGRPEGRAEEHWARAAELAAAEPDWLQREPAPQPEKVHTLKVGARRIAGKRAA